LGAATYGAWTQSMVFVTFGVTVVLMQFDLVLVRFVTGDQ
jgi:O-antigen/teichoic acid export membrane protein